MALNLNWKELPVVQSRFLFYSAAAAMVFLLLLLRLWYLQVISYEDLQERSVRNRTRVLTLDAPRGPIYDRHGELLVDNRPSFRISVMRQDVEDSSVLFARLAPLLEVDVAELELRWQQGKKLPIYRSVLLADDVSREIMERVQEHSVDLPGVLTEVRPVRDYLEKGSAAHLIGYLGEITKEELQSEKFSHYRGGDFVGKTALEKTFEPYLRGEKGRRLVEVDVQGKLFRQLKVEPASPGNKIYLTIDRDLQRAADEAFADQSGAAVALDVHTGEVLAMVSQPTFNPALFAQGIAGDEWDKLAKDSRHPLQNKVIAGQYPPGSTFKMIVALAALKAGTIGITETVDCDGAFEVGGSRYRCWKKSGHGPTDLKKALRESCDVWFYSVGLRLGIDKLSAAAKEFGLGSPVGYPLPGERSGTIPSQEWKQRRYNKPWYAGETVIAAIGQGFVLTTPIQLAVMMAAIANKGQVLKPQVVRQVEDWDGHLLLQTAPEMIRQIDYSAQAWDAVRDGLVAVVNEPHGTGHAAHIDTTLVAGKTGTSQVIRRKSDEEEELDEKGEIPYRFRPHALFVAYAPAEKPEIAVVVVVEHGQSGGSAAGPIVKQIIQRYMELKSQKAEGKG
ncbi:peptidoglycan glycosyltransferase [Desulfuromusa kysingii]|uniref:Peptidoglycan glycosyltransferase n=1 Tax=Desulfuromusa kysingii TaxID=37625 RepID=A0A1H4C532_9BACT|nr:penicillin-binding protein 2 [Desulfuromusa kysingii]SEA55202.1 peptidoglycan glycosyltransferase [Desulfuromusa kysingii]